MGNFAPSEILNVTYAEWELRKGSNPVFYVQGADSAGVTQYVAITGNVDNQFWTRVNIAADITDFEADHKPGGTSVPTLEDGIARLVGPKNIVGTFVGTIQRFAPRLAIIVVDTPIAGGATFTLIDITGEGQMDMIMANVEGLANWEVILTVDGFEVYRINVNDVKIRIANERGGFLFAEAIADFQDIYPTPFDWITSLKVQLKNVSGASKKIFSALCRHRVKV